MAAQTQEEKALIILREWVSDVDALFNGEMHLRDFWPDMFITYQKAAKLIKKGG